MKNCSAYGGLGGSLTPAYFTASS